MDDNKVDLDLRKSMEKMDVEGTVSAISRGADVNYSSNGRSRLIHRVARNLTKDVPEHGFSENMEIFKAFVDAPDLELNAIDDRGENASHIVAHQVNVEAFNVLKEAGSDLTVKNSDGRTPVDTLLLYGFLNGNVDAAKYAIELGASDGPKNSVTGGTFLHQLVSEVCIDEKDVDETGMKILDAVLLSKQFNLNIQKNDLTGIGHIVAKTGNIEVMEKLVNAGLNLNLENGNGRTAMDYWQKSQGTDLKQELANRKAEIDKIPVGYRGVGSHTSEVQQQPVKKEFVPVGMQGKTPEEMHRFDDLQHAIEEPQLAEQQPSEKSLVSRFSDFVGDKAGKFTSYIKESGAKVKNTVENLALLLKNQNRGK